MHITSLAYFPVLVKVLYNELPWKCPKLDGLSTLFCIIVGNMTLYHTINALCISTDYLVTRWQRLLIHNSGYFHKTHLFKVTNDPPVLFLHYRKRYSRPLESESATRTRIVEVPWDRLKILELHHRLPRRTDADDDICMIDDYLLYQGKKWAKREWQCKKVLQNHHVTHTNFNCLINPHNLMYFVFLRGN